AMLPVAQAVEAPFVAERGPRVAWRACPLQVRDAPLRDVDAIRGSPQPGEIAVEQRFVPVVDERRGEKHPTAQARDVPLARPTRNALERVVHGKNGGGSLH